jgi:hypothetical protein
MFRRGGSVPNPSLTLLSLINGRIAGRLDNPLGGLVVYLIASTVHLVQSCKRDKPESKMAELKSCCIRKQGPFILTASFLGIEPCLARTDFLSFKFFKLSFRFQRVWRYPLEFNHSFSFGAFRQHAREARAECSPFLLVLTFLGLVDGRVIGCLDDSLSRLVVRLAAVSTETRLVQS